jgi:hypothetical protein
MNPDKKEKMTQENSYSYSFTVKNSPREVMEKIRDIKSWWTTSFKGSSQKVGDTFTVNFNNQTFVDFRVSELIPDRRITWLVTDCNLSWLKDKKEWSGTKVDWELSPVEQGTQVTMTHFGLTPSAECYSVCQAGWNFYAGESLQRFITQGKGLPDQRPRTR